MYTKGKVLLSLANISLAFGDNLILRDINFDIKDIVRENQVTGQIGTIIGKSGVGKTQLFKIIAGLQKPTTGEVRIGEEQSLTHAGNVGVVAQNYPLFAHRTLLSNLTLVSNNHDKINWYLNELKMYEHKDKYPSQLSGGQRQRVAIMQQLLCSEHLLLMDEPFSGLDSVAKQIVCDLIMKVANMDEFNTIIIISHDVESSLAVSDIAVTLGHDYTPEGEKIPGAHIKRITDLAEMGLAWRPDISQDKQFMELCLDIKSLLKTI